MTIEGKPCCETWAIVVGVCHISVRSVVENKANTYLIGEWRKAGAIQGMTNIIINGFGTNSFLEDRLHVCSTTAMNN